jgi:pyrimidine nucleoside transport protein
MTVTVYWGIIYGYGIKGYFIQSKAGHAVLRSVWTPVKIALKKLMAMRFFSQSMYAIVVVTFVVFVVVDTMDDRRRLVSAFGLVVFIFLGAVFSKHPGNSPKNV